MLLWGCSARISPRFRSLRFHHHSTFLPAQPRPTMSASPVGDYSQWSPEKLIDKVKALELQLQEITTKYQAFSSTLLPPPSPTLRPKGPEGKRAFDPSKHSTRFVALKFAYLGQKYNGFEYHPNNTTPLPTIEEVLWRALIKAKLIFPTGSSLCEDEEINWEGCEYSKCGRTDRGVSAFGQVVGLRLRSNRPLISTARSVSRDQKMATSETPNGPQASPLATPAFGEMAFSSSDDEAAAIDRPEFDPIRDEIQYPQVLNRLLPPEIRVLAWCPSPPPNFSARFSCRERRYRYFFTQPAFNPTPGEPGKVLGRIGTPAEGQSRREGWLNIEAMKEAAKRYEGLHDFRNLCKVDASKQIQDFTRRIFLSQIQEVAPVQKPAAYVRSPYFSEYVSDASEPEPLVSRADAPSVYCFVLHGSAFLWHQVRHMVAILFLVGQGLEKPDVVDKLLSTKEYPSKPKYDMADDAPLVLWDCIFPDENSESREDSLDWIYVGDETGFGKFGQGGVVDDLWKHWREKKMDEILAGSLLNVVAGQGTIPQQFSRKDPSTVFLKGGNPRLFFGGNDVKFRGKYLPLMERPTLDTVEVINARYATKKGFDERGIGKKSSSNREGLETRTDHLPKEQPS